MNCPGPETLQALQGLLRMDLIKDMIWRGSKDSSMPYLHFGISLGNQLGHSYLVILVTQLSPSSHALHTVAIVEIVFIYI